MFKYIANPNPRITLTLRLYSGDPRAKDDLVPCNRNTSVYDITEPTATRGRIYKDS